MSSIDTDRIALANELYALADRFTLEAHNWKTHDEKVACHGAARTLNLIASQAACCTIDLYVADAYARAADTLIDHIVACRRFFTTLRTPPTIRGRHRNDT